MDRSSPGANSLCQKYEPAGTLPENLLFAFECDVMDDWKPGDLIDIPSGLGDGASLDADLAGVSGLLSGTPEERLNPVERTLHAAGYQPKDPGDLQRALVAYQAADLLRYKVLRIADRTAQKKVGRNDPCPCGSGRKYKKCCLGKSGGDVLSMLRAGVPPALLPRPWDDDEEDASDDERLGALLGSAPELEGIRFHRARLGQFIGDKLPEDFDTEDDDGRERILADLACDYVARYGETAVFRDYVEAAARCGARLRDMDKLRSLVAGCFYAIYEQAMEEGSSVRTPLTLMIFDATLNEGVEAAAAEETAEERAREAVLKATGGRSNRDLDAAELAALHENPPDEARELFRSVEARLAEIMVAIKDGSFPVYLPFPCVARAASLLMTTTSNDVDTASRLVSLAKEAMEQFCDEDVELYEAAVHDWLDTGEGTEEEAGMARLLLPLLRSDYRADIVERLVVATIQHADGFSMPFGPDVDREHGTGGRFEFFERYAEVLAVQGFQTLAERVLSCRELFEE